MRAASTPASRALRESAPEIQAKAALIAQTMWAHFAAPVRQAEARIQAKDQAGGPQRKDFERSDGYVQRAVRPLVLRTERQKYRRGQYGVRLRPPSASRPTDPAPSLMSSAPGRAALALRRSHLYMADHSGPQAGGVPVRASMRASRRSSSPYASRPSAAAATVASRSTRPDVCRTCRYSQTHVDTVRRPAQVVSVRHWQSGFDRSGRDQVA